jgi:hypothetical protein
MNKLQRGSLKVVIKELRVFVNYSISFLVTHETRGVKRERAKIFKNIQETNVLLKKSDIMLFRYEDDDGGRKNKIRGNRSNKPHFVLIFFKSL